jgi:hypothetical protein
MHKRTLETREPSCMHRVAKTFFIPVVHSPPGVVGHMPAPKLPSQEGRAPSRGAYGSTGAPLSGRQRPEPWDMWQRRSSPQQGGEIQSHGTHGGVRAHLCREVWSEATAYVAARGCTLCSLS